MNWPLKLGLSLHLHVLLGRVNNLATADNRCYQFGPRSGLSEKVNFEKKKKKKKKHQQTQKKPMKLHRRQRVTHVKQVRRTSDKCDLTVSSQVLWRDGEPAQDHIGLIWSLMQ